VFLGSQRPRPRVEVAGRPGWRPFGERLAACACSKGSGGWEEFCAGTRQSFHGTWKLDAECVNREPELFTRVLERRRLVSRFVSRVVFGCVQREFGVFGVVSPFTGPGNSISSVSIENRGCSREFLREDVWCRGLCLALCLVVCDESLGSLGLSVLSRDLETRSRVCQSTT